MVASSELDRLLSLVVFDARLNAIEGLDAFRQLLTKDLDGHVLRFLNRKMQTLKGKRRGGVAAVVAEHYRLTGDLKNLQQLFAIEDANVKESVLNALWEEPGSNPRMGAGIVELATQATNHASPSVRTEACYVFQNQCAWGVDVTGAMAALRSLLNDGENRVRQQAAYAVGHLAKGKYDMSQHLAQLRRNVRHKDPYVRESSAWALWQLSRYKHEIGSAVPELVHLLADDDEYGEHRKRAAGALLHHAKKTTDNAEQVRRLVKRVRLDLKRKDIQRFLEQLAGLKQDAAKGGTRNAT